MRRLSRSAAGLLLTAGLLSSGACWFERRPDPRNGDESGGDAPDTALVVTDGALRDSVRAVVTAFHDALDVGDAGRVASLSVLGATVFDQEEGVAWRLGPGGGDLLPRPLNRGGTGLGWEHSGADFVAWDRTALVVDRYAATVEGEGVPWTAVETVVLERTADGWRIRHVHRSRGAEPARPEPLGSSREGPA